MRFLKSGFVPFFAGVTIIIVYALKSPWKMGADSSPYPMSGFNVMFTVLFLSSCCAAAFYYGKRQNKSGLFGLAGIWALFYLSLLIAAIPGFYPFNTYVGVILFSYWTLFLVNDFFVILGAPAVMIIAVVFFWFSGRKRCG